MKRWKQILCLVLLALFFISVDLTIYFLFTRRCASTFGSATAAKAIEPADYLPFGENSGVVRIDGVQTLTGELPVLDGAAALLPVYASVFSSLYPEDACAFSDGSYTPESRMQYRNTRGAYQAIVDGDADLIFCAKPSREQLDYAAGKGVELELVPIGREAFVFLVNEKNPVDNLSQQQIRDIYAGKITNWKQVGGANRLISPLQRNEGSGSQTQFLAFMNGTTTAHSPFAFLGASIGFSFRYYVSGITQVEGIKLLEVDGMAPSVENIQSGAYPLTAEFYAVYRKGEENENVQRILDFLLSEKGQQIIEQSGYVPLS